MSQLLYMLSYAAVDYDTVGSWIRIEMIFVVELESKLWFETSCKLIINGRRLILVSGSLFSLQLIKCFSNTKKNSMRSFFFKANMRCICSVESVFFVLSIRMDNERCARLSLESNRSAKVSAANVQVITEMETLHSRLDNTV